jgi:hypothetical protein
MYLLMVAAIKKKLAAVIATALLPPFWINADLWTSKVTKAKFYGIRIFFKQEAQLFDHHLENLRLLATRVCRPGDGGG